MSRISYRKIDSENSKRLALLSLREFLNELPKVTIDEIEGLAATNTHLVGEPAEFGKNRTLRFSGHP
nr:hypothetical protein [Escherichia coli]